MVRGVAPLTDIPAPTKDCLFLAVFERRICPEDCSKVIIVDLLFVRHHELPPPLLAGLALHFVLIDGFGHVKFGEISLQMLVYLVVDLGKT